MHPRSSIAAVVVASVSILMLAGCGSGKPAAAGTPGAATSGAGTNAPTTAPATSTTTASTATPTTTATPSAAATPTAPRTASTSPTSAAPTPVAGWDSCAAVDVRLEKLNGVASGRTYFDLIVTNHGSRDCRLPGQPRLEFLGANYKPVQVAFSADPSAPSYLLGPNLSAAMSVGYSSAGNPPCDTVIAWVQVVSPGHDVPLDGRKHCAQDTYFENHWMPGTYAQPE